MLQKAKRCEPALDARLMDADLAQQWRKLAEQIELLEQHKKRRCVATWQCKA